MTWTKKLTQLNDVLGDLVTSPEGIMRYAKDAGLKPSMLVQTGTPLDIWNNVISEANKNGKVDDLIKAVQIKYPDDPFLKTAVENPEINYSLSPHIDEISQWEPISEDTLEVLTLEISTLLPINFLEQGILRSRSVGKVEIKNGANCDVGSGFLFRLEGQEETFFMTNYHVISKTNKIPQTRIIFNYELDIDGNSKASKSFKIDPNGPWICSPVEDYDVTIFKLIANNEELKEFGFIPLFQTNISKNDFVNIVQHPGGQMKQISLYHNVVTNIDEKRVQYLTDTLKVLLVPQYLIRHGKLLLFTIAVEASNPMNLHYQMVLNPEMKEFILIRL